MNFIQLVGKITEQPVKINSKTTSSHSDMKLAVHSNFREFNGHYRIDEFTIKLWKGVSDQICESYEPDRLVAVKGRVEIENSAYVIIAESVEILFC